MTTLPELVKTYFSDTTQLTPVSPHIWRVVDPQSKPNLALIFTGPSGVGKDTIVNLIDPELFSFFQTVTDRPRRENDRPNSYLWVEKAEFEQLKSEQAFLETNVYSGFDYGTPKSELTRIKNEKGVAVMRIDYNGLVRFRQLQAEGEESLQDWQLVSLMIIPPDLTQLKERLFGREELEVANQRWELVESELKNIPAANYIVVNEDGSQAEVAKEVENLIKQLSQKSGL